MLLLNLTVSSIQGNFYLYMLNIPSQALISSTDSLHFFLFFALFSAYLSLSLSLSASTHCLHFLLSFALFSVSLPCSSQALTLFISYFLSLCFLCPLSLSLCFLRSPLPSLRFVVIVYHIFLHRRDRIPSLLLNSRCSLMR